MKKCSNCKEEKELIEFNKKKDKLQPNCRICQGELAREYYKANKEKQKKQINEARRVRIKENRRKYFYILSTNPCVDCGEINPMALEFDHIDGDDKICGVGKIVGDGSSWKRIEEEMAKCEIRCANCHRIRTAKQFGWYKDFLLE